MVKFSFYFAQDNVGNSTAEFICPVFKNWYTAHKKVLPNILKDFASL